ncbi:MAG: sodium:calcium antiporter [Rhodobacteraceae bacterium]|nr:sodium:calcium antiporter [Paracoccaceae bacterium]
MGHSLLFLLVALPVSLAIVVIAANFFLNGAVSVAHSLSLPEFLVGSVIVAVGTSAPEVAINVSAVLGGAGDIVVSNIIGSNIVNIALGTGLAGLILSFDRARKEYSRTLWVGLLGALALLANTVLTANPGGSSHYSGLTALIFLVVFVLFMYNSIKSANADDDDEFDTDVPLLIAVVFIVLGAAAMAFFSRQAVIYAVDLSHIMGIPEAVIGATVVAAGGSLPEVSSCIAAARIRRPNLILGNIAGSQIFNVLGIIGLSGVIRPFHYSTILGVDIAILIGITLLLMLFIQVNKIRRFMGPVLVLSYGIYATYLVAVAT